MWDYGNHSHGNVKIFHGLVYTAAVEKNQLQSIDI